MGWACSSDGGDLERIQTLWGNLFEQFHLEDLEGDVRIISILITGKQVVVTRRWADVTQDPVRCRVVVTWRWADVTQDPVRCRVLGIATFCTADFRNSCVRTWFHTDCSGC
jgi:hypothetical protein